MNASLIVENVTIIKSGIMINVGECKNWKENLCRKNYVWNPAMGSCQNGKYVRNIIHDSEIIFGGIIGKKTVPTKSTSTNLYISLASFINFHDPIDSCKYLLLLHKITGKMKTSVVVLHHKKQIKFYIDNII